MADDDRHPPQAYHTVSPAGVGTTTTKQVSPGTVQEILDTGDQDLIDKAFDKMGIDDLTTYVQSLPSPSVPAGVGSQASRTPSTDGARTPHHGSPFGHQGRFEHLPVREVRDCWLPPARVGVAVVVVMVVGDVVVAFPPVDDQDEDDAHDALNPLPPCLGRPPVAHNKRHPEEHPLLEP